MTSGTSASANEILTTDPSVQPQGYRLSITPATITIFSADDAGAFYARQTLKQIRRQHPGPLPCLEIEDWPDFPHRGYMQDISRDKVPTMQTLFDLVDLLAELKINQLQLYTEHTFAYAGHEQVWRDASPMTPAQIRQLDAYCKERFIELVPNQNSFGHMERWLKHDKYRPLAECPDGFMLPWGIRHQGGFTLNPLDPSSFALIEDLFDQLLPTFSSKQFNIGCDETFDLGLGKSKAERERLGKHRVYLNFLLKIYEAAKAHGKTPQFWGDIILHNPELIPDLPKDMIALNWGYDYDHPFEKQTNAFADARQPFYVCPGTSSWLSIAGRSDNAIANLKGAAQHGLTNGAVGFLNTDWGDYGHLQYLPISYLALAAGAAYSWCHDSNRDLDLIGSANLHIFRDRASATGQVLFDLGNVYQAAKQWAHNTSRFFWALVYGPDRLKYYEQVTKEEFDDAERRVYRALTNLDRADMDRSDAKLIEDEIRNTGAMLVHACRRGRLRLGVEPIPKSQLVGDLNQIISEHKRLWLARNRPGGLSDSLSRLQPLLAQYA